MGTYFSNTVFEVNGWELLAFLHQTLITLTFTLKVLGSYSIIPPL